MTNYSKPYSTIPPVMTVQIEDAMDVMIVRDTTRRAAGLVGFAPAYRAQVSSAAAVLAELVLKTGEVHAIRMTGVAHNNKRGLQISMTAPWLAGASANNILVALRSKLGELVDEIQLTGNDDQPTIVMVMWLNPGKGKSQVLS
jgi:hypothetical protein